MTSNNRSTRPLCAGVAAGLAGALLAAACSGSDPAVDTANDDEQVATSTTIATIESVAPSSSELITLSVREDSEREQYVASPMGGVSFEVAAGDELLIAGDTVVVADRPIVEGGPTAGVGLTSQLMSGDPVVTVQDFVDAVAGVDGAVMEPTGSRIELFGYELVGYRSEAPASTLELQLFASERLGAPSQSGWSPFPLGIHYLAETPSGVLTVGTTGSSESDLEALEPALGTVVATIELTGSGFDPALTVDIADVVGPLSEPAAPAVAPDGAPPLLGAPFSPVEPGTYVVDNFGRAIVVDVPDGWSVQPNFPGFVVLTETGSIGPGDRDIVMLNGVIGAVPTSGPVSAGDLVPLDDIDAFLGSPPDAVTVDGVERLDIDGVAVVQFDVMADPAAACSSEDPCDLTFVTNYGAEKTTQSTQRHRIWWITDHPNGPAMIIAMDRFDGTFIEAATEVIQAARFLD